MKKTIFPFALALFVLFVTAQPIHALNIVLNDAGMVTLTQGQVLGDETEQLDSAHEVKKLEPQKDIKYQETLRKIPVSENKQLRIKNEQDKTNVTIERKLKERVENQEKIETKDLKIELPVRQKIENIQNNTGERKPDSEQIKKIIEERQQRKDKLEISTQPADDGAQHTELKAGEIKARLKAAEFVVDPTTNSVTITTPSGETHTLVHLPDQALEQMKKAGLIDSVLPSDQTNLEVEPNADGTVTYKTQVTEKRNLFGFIPFEAKKEVVLDDASGLTSSKPVSNSFLDRWLFRLSK